LAAFEVWNLFFPVGAHGYGTKFDALDGEPRGGVVFDQLDTVETGLLKAGEVFAFGERSGNAAALELGVAL